MIGAAAVILTSSNIIVYHGAAKHDKFIRLHSRRQSNIAEKQNGKKMVKASFVCLAVVASFVVCWIPYFIHNVLTLSNTFRPGSKKAFTIFAEQFSLLNSLLDPIIFVILSRDTKSLIKSLCGKSDDKESTGLLPVSRINKRSNGSLPGSRLSQTRINKKSDSSIPGSIYKKSNGSLPGSMTKIDKKSNGSLPITNYQFVTTLT